MSISLEGLWADADSVAKLKSTSALNFICEALTPELSRTARGSPVESETAKRSRLERIVRPHVDSLGAENNNRIAALDLQRVGLAVFNAVKVALDLQAARTGNYVVV